jgi:hypothetical protein
VYGREAFLGDFHLLMVKSYYASDSSTVHDLTTDRHIQMIPLVVCASQHHDHKMLDGMVSEVILYVANRLPSDLHGP